MHDFINVDFMRSLVVMQLVWRCREPDGGLNSMPSAG